MQNISMPRVILHLDMDAFFASIEQLDHPEYRGKPVIVGADPKGGHGRGVVSTASYEARKYGVHSAMPISQAYHLCPHGIYLPVRMERYQEVSRHLMRILEDFTPLVEPVSIDEAFLDLTGSLKLFGRPEEIGLSIKKRIKEKLRLTASVGIAPNKFVAKIASDLQKPDGFVVVKDNEVKSFLADLPISKLWGVGKKTESLLLKMGISTIGELAKCTQERIVKCLGKNGLVLWQLAHGIDHRPVTLQSVTKSVSQETTFEQDTDDEHLIEQTLFQLAESLARIMRKQELKGRTITLKIRLEDFSTFTRSRTFSHFTNSPDFMRDIAIGMFRKFNRHGKKVRLLGIGMSQLNTIGGEQTDLFDQEMNRNQKINQVVDLVQDQFGTEAIKKATLL